MPPKQTAKLSLFAALAAVAALVACGGQQSSPFIAGGETPDRKRTRDPAGTPQKSLPTVKLRARSWAHFPLGYASGGISGSIQSGGAVWFTDDNANIIGKVGADNSVTTYSAGQFVFPVPTGTPIARPADPVAVAPGPNDTTYYLASYYGYGITQPDGTSTLYTTYCYTSYKCSSDLEVPFGFTIAATQDGSAWWPTSETPGPGAAPAVIARAKGSDVTVVPVPTTGPPYAGDPPGSVTVGPDQNVWYAGGNSFW